MYKEELALNNLQGLICHKETSEQAKSRNLKYYLLMNGFTFLKFHSPCQWNIG